MSKVVIPTSFNIDLEFHTPAFHKRFFAWFIDIVLIILYCLAVEYSLSASNALNKEEAGMKQLYNLSFLGLILLVPALVYHLATELFLNGQSIGKKLMGLQVISETGKRPEMHQFMIRWLLRVVDISLTLGCAGMITTLLTQKNQRLGDLASGTLVIDKKNVTTLSDTIFQDVSDQYVPKYPSVLQLSDRDLNTIKSIYESCRKTRNYEHAGRVSEKIRNALGINTYEDDIDFLETLLTDYNFLSTRQ